MLLAEKFSELFPKHKGHFFILESFALEWYVGLTNENLLLPLQCRLKQNFLFDLWKLIEYQASAVKVVSSNPCVRPIPKINISFFLLLICTDELMSTPKIVTFLPTLASVNDNSEREHNPIPKSLYTGLFGSASSANLTLPNRQSFKVKSEFKSPDHVSNL